MTDKAQYDGRYPEPPYTPDLGAELDLIAQQIDLTSECDRLRGEPLAAYAALCLQEYAS